MAADQRVDENNDDEDPLERDRKVLRVEAAQRNKRIRIRREQQLKKDAAKRIAKRKRMFKVAGAWVVVLIAGFLVVVWFSPDLMKMVRNLFR